MITVHDFSFAGLLPPFPEFLIAVLETYGLHMLHLHPNAARVLATFAYASEAFVGVAPSVALFRHFLVPHLGKSRRGVGGVTFRLRRDAELQYPEALAGTFVEEWRQN